MGNDYHGHAFLGKRLHKVENLANHLGVECGGRLVKKNNRGIHCKGTNDGNSLLLTARESSRICIRLILKADSFKKLHSPCIFLCDNLRFSHKSLGAFTLAEHTKYLLLTHIAKGNVDWRKSDILNNSLIVEEIKLLEYHSHTLSVDIDINSHIRNINALKIDRTLAGVFHAIKATKKR